MKHVVALLILGIVCSLTITSCQKILNIGPVVTEERNVTGFTDIDSKGSFNVFVTQGSAYKVTLEGGQNILNVIETTVKDKELIIKVKNGRVISNNAEITVYITMPEIRSLEVSGSGDIDVQHDLITSDINLKVSGSGSIHVPYMEADELEAKISGSGRIDIDGGTVYREQLNIKGSGDMDMFDLVATKSKIQVSGSGSVYVHVTDQLEVEISGSGDVHYKGDPTVETSISGSGRLIHE